MPLGREAAKLERDLWTHVTALLRLTVHKDVHLWGCTQLNSDVVEALVTVPDGDREKPCLVEICRKARKVIRFENGWPL